MIDTNNLILPTRNLPIIPTVKRAYEILWQYRRITIRAALIPLILMTVAVAIQSRFFGDAQTPDQLKDAFKIAPSGVLFSWMLLLFLSVLTLTSFNISWRRFLLLEEPPSCFSFGKVFWRYLAFGLAVYVGFFIYIIVTSLILSSLVYGLGASANPTILKFSIILIAIAIIGVFLWGLIRHILLFTAIIVDNDLSWHGARLAMNNNIMRFAAIWVLTIIPIGIISGIISFILAVSGINVTAVGSSLLVGFLQAVTTLVEVILMSSVGGLVYDFLVRGGGPKKI